MKAIYFFLFFSLTWCFQINAKIYSVELGINGLTCSQCSRSVEMKLRELDFISDVHMDLESNIGRLTLNETRLIDIDKIAQAVVNAGFSVRYIQADIDFEDAEMEEPGTLKVGNMHCRILDYFPGQTYYGRHTIQFAGQKYMDPATWKRWKKQYPILRTENKVPYYYILFVA